MCPWWARGNVVRIAYGETVTGSIEYSEAGSSVQPINYVGHMGTHRIQGDFDVWYFDAAKGDNAVITVTATDGDLVPTLLVIDEVEAGVLFQFSVAVRSWTATWTATPRPGIVCASSTRTRSSASSLPGRRIPSRRGLYPNRRTSGGDQELSGGSETAVCRVGTFVITGGNYRVNIRSNPGSWANVKGADAGGRALSHRMECRGEWAPHRVLGRAIRLTLAYVKSSLIQVTGSLDEAATP